MDLLALIQASNVEGFNEARESVGRIDLFAQELAELKLTGIDLSEANLDKSDLTDTDLTEARLMRAYMSDIDGTGLVLDGVLAMRVKMRDAWMEKADLRDGDFSYGDLSGAVLTGSKAEGARFVSAKLKDAKADASSWQLVDLTEANLRGIELTGTDLARAKLTEAKAPGAQCEGATFDGADAVGVVFAGANLKGCTFRGARMAQADLSGADLTGADLSHVDLSSANLAGANLTGADLTGATLADALLDDATLEGVTWSEADLTGLDAAVLGLPDTAIDQLASHGARFDPDAAWSLDDAVVACAHGCVAVAWMNPDDAETATFRWALVQEDGTQVAGVLPVSGESVLFHAVQPNAAGFELFGLVDRPGGICVMRWPLAADGTVTSPAVAPLGYEPAVLPVLRSDEHGLWMWCLARRGPMLVVHRDAYDGEGLKVVDTARHAQASGFFGRTHPVLAGKGKVVMPVTLRGVGEPCRMPEGFPTRTATAVPTSDRVLAVWNTIPRLRDPGGLRFQWLGGRRHEDTEELTRIPDVNALDGVPHGEGVLLAWTESEGPDGGHVLVAQMDDVPAVREVKVPAIGLVDGIRIVPAWNGEGPWLAVTSLAGGLVVCTLEGVALAQLGES